MFIKKYLLKMYFHLKRFIDYHFMAYKTNSCFSDNGRPKIFLIGTPEHDNLGDHAIAFSELYFLKKNFVEFDIVEITIEKFWLYFKNLKSKINRKDIICFTGGGNMGDIYYDEIIRLETIKHIRNPIVVFPQTIFFKKKEKNKLMDKMIKIYNNSDNILLCAREQDSFNLMKKMFPRCKVLLCPDMVFYLKNMFEITETKKTKIGICFRDDFEQSSSNEERNQCVSLCLNLLELNEGDINYFDTRLFNQCIIANRKKYLTDLLNTIASFKLCITDRLHATIFSIIIGTPVLSIASESPKIKSTIETFFSNVKDDIFYQRTIDNASFKKVDFNFDSYYKKLLSEIRSIIFYEN